MPSPSARSEKRAAYACVALGVLAAAAFAPRDAGFLPNFVFFWGPQAAVVLLALVLRLRAAAVAGTSFSLALYFCLFAAWLFTRARPESPAWLGYLLSLPGAAVGLTGAAVWIWWKRPQGSWASGIAAGAAVAVGIAINQAVICNTVLYCMGK